MGCLGNVLWFVFGGAVSGLSWCLAGCLWCITVVGIPVGMQCFKFAALSFFPFGKEVQYGGGAGSFLLNIIWLIVSGLPLALEHLALGTALCVTIIGIPFGLQQFKLANTGIDAVWCGGVLRCDYLIKGRRFRKSGKSWKYRSRDSFRSVQRKGRAF